MNGDVATCAIPPLLSCYLLHFYMNHLFLPTTWTGQEVAFVTSRAKKRERFSVIPFVRPPFLHFCQKPLTLDKSFLVFNIHPRTV